MENKFGGFSAAPARAGAKAREERREEARPPSKGAQDNMTTYAYLHFDQLNRLTQKTYSDSTAVNYTSDYLGRIGLEKCDSRLTAVTERVAGVLFLEVPKFGRDASQTARINGLHWRDFRKFVGAPRRNRTYNLWIKSPLLCQLS